MSELFLGLETLPHHSLTRFPNTEFPDKGDFPGSMGVLDRHSYPYLLFLSESFWLSDYVRDDTIDGLWVDSSDVADYE